jgi:hypothetical protein
VGEQFGAVSQAEIMLRKGDGTFSSTQIYPVESFPNGAAVADFRTPASWTLAFARLYGELLGNGDGSFT